MYWHLYTAYQELRHLSDILPDENHLYNLNMELYVSTVQKESQCKEAHMSLVIAPDRKSS